MTTLLATLALISSSFAAELADAPSAEAVEASGSDGSTFTELHPTPPKSVFGGVRHGVRTGYVYVNDADDLGLANPHLFALGYEAEIKIVGDKGLDFIIVPNTLILGMNQGRFVPTGNLLIGLSFVDLVKVGVGGNVTPNFSGRSWISMVAGVEVVPKVGKLQLPLAVSYVPSVDGNWRVGATVGVNWPKPE